jgi:DNA-binding response OmpR family regulator
MAPIVDSGACKPSDGHQPYWYRFPRRGRLPNRCSSDLLVTDIDMPHLSGIELAQSIREERPETKILLVSGGGTSQSEFPVLGKPFTPETLQDKIRYLLAAVRGARG